MKIPLLFLLAFFVPPIAAADGRIPISGPATLTQPGSYYVTRDFSNNGLASAIIIDNNDITLDLNGHTLTCGSGTAYCVETVNRMRIRITGGTLRGGNIGLDFYNDGFNGSFTIDHMQLTGQSTTAINIYGASSLSIQADFSDNRITNVNAGIALYYLNGGRIDHNLIQQTTGGDAVYINNSSGMSVRDNTISVGSQHGISLETSATIDITGNNVGTVRYGSEAILLNNSSLCRISQNIASPQGISIRNSIYNTIDWNLGSCTCIGSPICYCVGLAIDSNGANVYSNNRGGQSVGTGNIDGGGNH